MLPVAAAVLAAGCGWPASRAVRAYTQRTIGPLLLAPPMALLAGLAAWLVHPGLVACAAAWLAICAVPLAVIDALAFRLPDPLTLAALAGTAAFLVAAAAASGDWAACSWRSRSPGPARPASATPSSASAWVRWQPGPGGAYC